MPIYNVVINGIDNDKVELDPSTKRVYLTSGTTHPTYVETTSIGTSTTTSLAVSYTNVDAGDILILQFATKQNATFTLPSGWSSISNSSGTAFSVRWCYKIATGSESGTVSTTVSSTGNSAGIMSRYRGGTAVSNGGSGVYTSVSSLGNNSIAALNDLGCSSVGVGANVTVTTSGGGFTQDYAVSTSLAGGFAFGGGSIVGTGSPTANVTMSWGSYQPAALFSSLRIEK